MLPAGVEEAGGREVTGEVVTWDYIVEGPTNPETWVQVVAPSMKVCGGFPNVVASDGRNLYRHTPNGMLWVSDSGRPQASPPKDGS